MVLNDCRQLPQASPLLVLSKVFDLGCWLLTAIISHFDRQLLGNKLSFTLCSIHILFKSNKFHKFWMSYDFRSRCNKNWWNWAQTQTDRPPLGRLDWHPWRSCHILDLGAKWHTHNASESWIECRFDWMDRKACTRIKGPTTQRELMFKSVTLEQSQASRHNIGGMDG